MHGAEPRLYVLVRRDLPWPIRLVQAAHAVAELMHEQAPHWEPPGPVCVVLGVRDAGELGDWLAHLASTAVGFREPDLGDELTALALFSPPRPDLATLPLL